MELNEELKEAVYEASNSPWFSDIDSASYAAWKSASYSIRSTARSASRDAARWSKPTTKQKIAIILEVLNEAG